jgi:NADPH-dependent 2,4-dienoyl-CoA reductase/sulfur reductase-like enzyme
MTRTDVLVIGAGPAGIAAATAAAESGRSVLVLDDNAAAGGQIWREAPVAARAAPSEDKGPKQRALARLARSGAKLLTGRSVFNAEASGLVYAMHETAGVFHVEPFRFERLILATGARERLLPFPGWTLPGVFGAGGLQALGRGGYPIAGKRVVVAGTGPLLLAVAAHLAQDGAVVSKVVEQAPLARLLRFGASLGAEPAKLLQGVGYGASIGLGAYRTGCWVVEAVASNDGSTLAAVRITDGWRTWLEACDLLAIGYHLVPNAEVAEMLGCAFEDGFVQVDGEQRTSVPNVFCVGEPTGIAGLEAALLEGEIAGRASAGKSVLPLQAKAAKQRGFGERLASAFALRDELRRLPQPETIVCRCEDVSFGSLTGRNGWTDAKLQTRCGMGACQGRVCGPAIEYLLGWKNASVRQPLYPVPLEAFCSAASPISGNTTLKAIEENV